MCVYRIISRMYLIVVKLVASEIIFVVKLKCQRSTTILHVYVGIENILRMT